MKKILAILSLPFLASLAWVGADELKASELAKALGVDWWEIEIPAGDKDDVSLAVCIVFSDGRKDVSGAMSGFRAGSKVKLFCWPSEETGKLNVSLVAGTGCLRTSLLNAFGQARISTYAIPAGGTAKIGDLLRKGSATGEVVADQTLREGEFGLMVIAK